MFSHIQIGARNLDAMIAFYDAVLTPLGLVRMTDHDDGPAGAGWHLPGQSWPQFFVQLPFNGLPATSGNGVQVSFAASSQNQVRAAWQAATTSGARMRARRGCDLSTQPIFLVRTVATPRATNSALSTPKAWSDRAITLLVRQPCAAELRRSRCTFHMSHRR